VGRADPTHMETRRPDEPWLNARARASLGRALRAFDAHSEAPLRVRGHARGRGHDVFDVQEEFEIGDRGRRFLLSIDAEAHEMMLLAMGGGPGEMR
jgi:hypothetical protein